MRRILLPLVLAVAATPVAVPPATAAPPPAAPPRATTAADRAGPGLAAPDRARLARTPATARVRLLIATGVGDGDEAARLVRAAGGTVRTVSDRAGAVVADVPAGRAAALARHPVVEAVALDRKVRRRPPVPVRPAGKAGPAALPSPGAVNPYLPAGDIGAPQFVARNPAYDGRGQLIAVIDDGVSWTAPGLQRTTTGRHKVARWSDVSGYGNIDTSREVLVTNGRFTVGRTTYQLPAGLTHRRVRFGTITENRGEFSIDYNRDGDRVDVFGVAVVESPRRALTLFVDTDQDRLFGDETPMADWNATRRTDTFGRDDPRTRHVEEVFPFGVLQCQRSGPGACSAAAADPGDLWTMIFDGPHGTHVASTAAGHDFRLWGGRFDGVAPGAQLWAIRAFGFDAAWNISDEAWQSEILAAIVLAAEGGADVVNMSFGMTTPLGPPHDPVSTLMDNVAAAYGVSFAVANGNSGPGLQMEGGSPGTARAAVTAGGYVSAATYAANAQRPGMVGERVVYFSSQGPELDGHWSPDVVTPAVVLAAVPRFYSEPGLPLQGSLPPGYAAFSGTSMASPMLAGSQALLRSAADATGVRYTTQSVKRAIELGARPVRGPRAYRPEEQGHGLV